MPVNRPFFSFYGGKHRSINAYPRPKHSRIIECFAGSAAYSTRYYTADVTLVDEDPIIAGIWRYLTRVSRSEILALPLVGPDETLDAVGAVPQEARWLIGFWLARGEVGPRRTPSPWMRQGKWPGSFWGERIRSRIAEQVERIRHWRIVESSYTDIPTPPATWFLDPPYQGKGIHYRYGSPRIDFGHLGGWSRALPGQVIVCEQAGAAWLPFSPLMELKTVNRKDGTLGYSKEVIYTQGDEPEQRSLLLAG